MAQHAYVSYCRVSASSQGRSGLGLEGQQMAVREFLAANPGRFIAELTEVDSGRKNNRPKLNEALRLCRVYDSTLVVARLDRLARNVTLIARLMESGADFVAADLPEANRFTLHMLAAVAEYESTLISERVKAACAAAKSAWRPPRRSIEGKPRCTRGGFGRGQSRAIAASEDAGDGAHSLACRASRQRQIASSGCDRIGQARNRDAARRPRLDAGVCRSAVRLVRRSATLKRRRQSARSNSRSIAPLAPVAAFK